MLQLENNPCPIKTLNNWDPKKEKIPPVKTLTQLNYIKLTNLKENQLKIPSGKIIIQNKNDNTFITWKITDTERNNKTISVDSKGKLQNVWEEIDGSLFSVPDISESHKIAVTIYKKIIK